MSSLISHIKIAFRERTPGAFREIDPETDPLRLAFLEAGWAPPEEASLLRDALDHIKRTAYHSRTQTRRLRWISRRAREALAGEPFSFDATEEPPNAPCVAGMEKQLRHAQRALAEMTEERDRAYELGRQAFIDMQRAEEQRNEAQLDERQAIAYLQRAREALGHEGDFPSMVEAIRAKSASKPPAKPSE